MNKSVCCVGLLSLCMVGVANAGFVYNSRSAFLQTHAGLPGPDSSTPGPQNNFTDTYAFDSGDSYSKTLESSISGSAGSSYATASHTTELSSSNISSMGSALCTIDPLGDPTPDSGTGHSIITEFAVDADVQTSLSGFMSTGANAFSIFVLEEWDGVTVNAFGSPVYQTRLYASAADGTSSAIELNDFTLVTGHVYRINFSAHTSAFDAILSDSVEYSFALPVPAPASTALLAVVPLALRRRR